MNNPASVDPRMATARPARHGARSLFALLLASSISWSAHAQLLSVPRMGVAGDWVKNLEIGLDSEWEWVETGADRVYFATSLGAARRGDLVTMWVRVEYRDPQPPGNYLSVAEKNQWDCSNRRRSVIASVLHRWNNLRDSAPVEATVPLRTWEDIKPDTVGEPLLDFACSLHPARDGRSPTSASGDRATPAAKTKGKPVPGGPAQ